MPRITELYAYVIPDADEDDEGVPATVGSDGMFYPLMGADLERAESLKDTAQKIADAAGKTVRLVRSTGLETVCVIEPQQEESNGC